MTLIIGSSVVGQDLPLQGPAATKERLRGVTAAAKREEKACTIRTGLCYLGTRAGLDSGLRCAVLGVALCPATCLVLTYYMPKHPHPSCANIKCVQIVSNAP